MIKVFELQQQVDDITQHQSRVVEYESFQEYLQNVNERSLPREFILYKKHVNFKEQTITFHYEHELLGKFFRFMHFAKVIG